MIRLFREHDLRQEQSLDEVWDFAFLGDVTADAVELSKIDFNDRMPVPGCFDATPNYAGKRGLVAYRTTTRLGDLAVLRYPFVIDCEPHSGKTARF